MKIANYYTKCANAGLKQYRHWLWLHSLNDFDYTRAMRLWQNLYGLMPRGFEYHTKYTGYCARMTFE